MLTSWLAVDASNEINAAELQTPQTELYNRALHRNVKLIYTSQMYTHNAHRKLYSYTPAFTLPTDKGQHYASTKSDKLIKSL